MHLDAKVLVRRVLSRKKSLCCQDNQYSILPEMEGSRVEKGHESDIFNIRWLPPKPFMHPDANLSTRLTHIAA